MVKGAALLSISLLLGACSRLSTDQEIHIALLHIAPTLAQSERDIDRNTALISRAMQAAKAQGADWVMTPELSLTGYQFNRHIGSDWITPGPDRWTRQLQQQADQLDVILLLSHLEKDPVSNRSYNTLFVINREGKIVARHRKINTIPGAESWSSPGTETTLIDIDGIRAGLLICADAWPPEHAQTLKQQGAELLLSSANWPPGQYGPGIGKNRVWEKRSAETGLPIIVNNRTGREDNFDMSQGQSVAITDRPSATLEFQSTQNSVVMIILKNLNTAKMTSKPLP